MTMANNIFLEEHKLHTFRVVKIDNTNKIIQMRSGAKVKYIIHFENGYQGEVLVDINTTFLHGFQEGKFATFRIGYRKEGFLDEINFVDSGQIEKNPIRPAAGPVSNATAYLALKLAVESAPENHNMDSIEFTERADIFKEWIERNL